MIEGEPDFAKFPNRTSQMRQSVVEFAALYKQRSFPAATKDCPRIERMKRCFTEQVCDGLFCGGHIANQYRYGAHGLSERVTQRDRMARGTCFVDASLGFFDRSVRKPL